MDARSKFLTKFYDEKSEGNSYVYSESTNDAVMKIPDWELRFAIFPDQKNINKAAEVIDRILSAKENFSYKLVSFNKKDSTGTPMDSWYVLGSEGPYTRINSLSDRDQRTKELCWYLRFQHNGTPERSPAELKELILKLWKGFIDAGVKIGYMSPQIGDKALPGDVPTPVSYAHLDRDWTALNNTFWKKVAATSIELGTFEEKSDDSFVSDADTNQLYEAEWKQHHQRKQDPLAGVKITYEDLNQAGIPYSFVYEMQKQKIAYLEEHSREALDNFYVTFDAMAQKYSDEKEYPIDKIQKETMKKLEQLRKIIETANQTENPVALDKEEQKTIKGIMEDIIEVLPRHDEKGILCPPIPIHEMLSLINGRYDSAVKQGTLKTFYAIFKDLANAAIDYIKDDKKMALERQRIYELYTVTFSTQTDKLLEKLKISKKQLFTMIVAQPGQMELLFRHFREICKEKIFLQQERNVLSKMKTPLEKQKDCAVEFMQEVIEGMGLFGASSRKYVIFTELKKLVPDCKTEKALRSLLYNFTDVALMRRMYGAGRTASAQKAVELLKLNKYASLRPYLIEDRTVEVKESPLPYISEASTLGYNGLLFAHQNLNSTTDPSPAAQLDEKALFQLFSSKNKNKLYTEYGVNQQSISKSVMPTTDAQIFTHSLKRKP